jgi:acetolactate synthase-1/2/3 large subunit
VTLDEARRTIAAARRVVVLVDDYLLTQPGATRALAGFADSCDATVFQARYRRGPMLFQRLDPNAVPGFVGWYDPERRDHVRAVEEADLLVTVEDRNLYERVIGRLPNSAKLAITSDAGKTRKNAYLQDGDLLLEGTPADILHALAGPNASIGTEETKPRRPRRPALTEATDVAPNGLSRRIGDAVSRCLALIGSTTVVDDSQMLGGLLAESYDTAFGTVAVRGNHGGFVGAGIALATGLAIDSGQPVLCLLGDQGFTNGYKGLIAAAQEAAPVLYLVVTALPVVGRPNVREDLHTPVTQG